MVKYSVPPLMSVQYHLGSDYFTKNFQVKENKTKMRNIYLRFFHLLFRD